jgi:hypothetical protein
VEEVGAFRISSDQAADPDEGPDMDDCTCGVDVPGMHVLDVAVDGRDRLVLTVETDQADGPTGQVETFVEAPGRAAIQLLTRRNRYSDAVSRGQTSQARHGD